jgi:hypothetical protein
VCVRGDNKVLRSALYSYTASLAAEYDKSLAPDDVFNVGGIVELYKDSFETASDMKEGFGKIAEYLANRFEIGLDSNLESRRRATVLKEVGMSFFGELESTIVSSVSTSALPTLSQEFFLDTEYIAIYW